jgi:hypothetical protein
LAFCARQEFTSFKHARYTCFGCVYPIGQQEFRLIEDERGFPRLLDCVDEYLPNPRSFRKCYHGLLHAYVVYDPEQEASKRAGKENWQLLRTYLDVRVGKIRIHDSTEPDWVDSISRNHELLTGRACTELGRKALDGDHSHFESVCKTLEISDQSWVVRNFVWAQLDAAAAKSDSLYRQLLPRLQELLETHPLLLDEGLTRLLERYRTCAQTEVNVGLRDFAVNRWGNPWLQLNDKRWGRVSSEAREMVTGWLKLKLMRDFFRLLSEDSTKDRKRRLEFWLRYIDQINDMYFALGRDALHNPDPDFRQIRSEMKGRLLHLYASQASSNNAFLMSIGNHMVVEFGDKGNAFFAFDKRKGLPFKLEGDVAGNGAELKHASHVLRLTHVDTNEGRWEERFERQLENWLGIFSGRPPTRTAPTKPNTPRSTPYGSNMDSDSTFSQSAFELLAQANRLATADKRKLGGALWVYLGKADTPVTRQLRRWGFKYNEHKTAWWRG